MITLRPADANEVVEAWKVIMQLRHEPAALVLTRQALPTFNREQLGAAEGVFRGAYVLAEAIGGRPDVILIGTGSEGALCLGANRKLTSQGINARVVSMPSWELFEKQPQSYRDEVLPPDVLARLAVEQGSTFCWDRYTWTTGKIIGIKTFGASAPLKALQAMFSFTPNAVAAAAKEQLTQNGRAAA